MLRDIAAARVSLVAFGRAGELIDGVGPRSFLHSGPPLAPEDTIGAMRGGLIGALLIEGEAGTPEEAHRIIDAGDLEISSCNDHGGVGPLGGAIGPSTPVVVVERAGGRRSFAAIVEGLGKALSFGNFDPETLEKSRWLGGEFSEVLNKAFGMTETMDLVDMQAKALRRGDENHNRLVAATENLVARLSPAFLDIGERARATLLELTSNPHFFLTLSMAAAKAVADTILEEGPPGIVTALAGNGIHCGIKVSGASRPWYVAEGVKPTDLMLIPGRTEVDATPLMGDSGVTETVGLGAFSLTSSLALARVLGVDAAGAARVVDQMRQITVTEHPRYQLPADDFRGSPFGISVRKVTDTRITPAVNAGYAHKVAGEGRVGANLGRFPIDPFEEAARGGND